MNRREFFGESAIRTTGEAEGDHAVISRIRDDQVSAVVELQSVGCAERSRDYRRAVRCAGKPALYAPIPGIEDIHKAIGIDSDAGWIAELVGPWARITARSRYNDTGQKSVVPTHHAMI